MAITEPLFCKVPSETWKKILPGYRGENATCMRLPKPPVQTIQRPVKTTGPLSTQALASLFFSPFLRLTHAGEEGLVHKPSPD